MSLKEAAKKINEKKEEHTENQLKQANSLQERVEAIEEHLGLR